MKDLITYGIYPFCAIFSTIMLYAIAIELEKIAKKK